MSSSSKTRFTPKILTAYDLLLGEAVYWSPCGTWKKLFHQALLLTGESRANVLLAAAQADAGRVFGAYLAEARTGADGRPQPTHFREAFRTRGPSNLFHGKQAELASEGLENV